MSEHETGQVARSAAEVYETFFVPSLFADWPDRLLKMAGVGRGERVLDIACGTGVLAREAVTRVGDSGTVVGLDINPAMLEVARSKSTMVAWEEGAAEALPFDDSSFDHVFSQFGLMFFQDRSKAASEMVRVLKADGTGCVAVWASLQETPGYVAVAEMLHDLFGPEIARSVEAPYSLGEARVLEEIFKGSGAQEVVVTTLLGRARFESIDSWIYTDIRGWTLADRIDDQGYARLKEAAPDYLSRFVQPDGTVGFDAPARVVSFAA